MRTNILERIERNKLTNQLFNLWIEDLCTSLNITRYRIAKDLNLNNQFLYNKRKGDTVHFVSLSSIYMIATYYNFPFELLKYDNQYKSQLAAQSV
jgi:transcriptional regulator with XRE-family HTH domain